jgi:hypothetical protein
VTDKIEVTDVMTEEAMADDVMVDDRFLLFDDERDLVLVLIDCESVATLGVHDEGLVLPTAILPSPSHVHTPFTISITSFPPPLPSSSSSSSSGQLLSSSLSAIYTPVKHAGAVFPHSFARISRRTSYWEMSYMNPYASVSGRWLLSSW